MDIKNKALLAYVVIFLVGGASGFFLNEAFRPHFPDDEFKREYHWNNGFSGPQQEQWRERMRQRIGKILEQRLDLEEDQTEPFFEVLDEHLDNLHNGIREHEGREVKMIRELYSRFLKDAEKILTEEQLKELNRIAHPDSVKKRRVLRLKRSESR